MAFKGDSIYWVEVEKVVPNPFQPRREFDEHKLRELADSIRMYGVLQPLTVTRQEVQREDGTFYTEYELIAGERRLRASKLAGTSQVPVIIREGEDSEQEKLELAIIENLQREDLNAVDRALAFRQLAEQFGLSHAQVAQKVGRSREYVSNSIRLLALPEHILDALKRSDISEGHARTLLMLADRQQEQEVVFQELLLKKLSVRELERIVRKIATDRVRKKNPQEFDSELIEIEKRFSEALGTRVQIQKTDFGGKVTIDYFSVDDLSQMLTRMQADLEEKSNTAAELAKLAAHTPLQPENTNEGKPETIPVADTAPVVNPFTPQVPTEQPQETNFPQTSILQSQESQTPQIAQISQETPAPVETNPVWPWVKPVSEQTNSTTNPMVNENPKPVVSTETTIAETPVTAVNEEPNKESSGDDSDLYSIRNFTV